MSSYNLRFMKITLLVNASLLHRLLVNVLSLFLDVRIIFLNFSSIEFCLVLPSYSKNVHRETHFKVHEAAGVFFQKCKNY